MNLTDPIKVCPACGNDLTIKHFPPDGPDECDLYSVMCNASQCHLHVGDFGKPPTILDAMKAGTSSWWHATIDALAVTQRRLAAERADPSGGADLGFAWTTSGWQRTRGGVTILIRAKDLEGDERWVRAKFRAGKRIGRTDYFTYARDAMEAK